MSGENRQGSHRSNHSVDSPATAGQDSTVSSRTRSRAPLRGGEPEQQLPQRSRRRRNLEAPRDRSRSPVDRNIPQPENMQRPPLHFQQREEPAACAICSQALEEGAQTRALGCSHRFHLDCLRNWLMHRETCPTCGTRSYMRIQATFDLQGYGNMTIVSPAPFWRRNIPFSINFMNGEPTLQGLPGEDSPIHPVRGSRSLWGRVSQEHLPHRSRTQNPDTVQRDTEELPTCPICLDELQEETGSTSLPCTHQFHTGCITRWMQDRTGCPLCRTEITWNIRCSFSLPNYGRMSITVPGRFWSRQPDIWVTGWNNGSRHFNASMPPPT